MIVGRTARKSVARAFLAAQWSCSWLRDSPVEAFRKLDNEDKYRKELVDELGQRVCGEEYWSMNSFGVKPLSEVCGRDAL